MNRSVTVILLGIIMALFITSAATAQRRKVEIVKKIDGDEVYKLMEPDGIPAIRNPQYVSGDSADQQMMDEESVIGIHYNGVTRAYSLWQLDHHEIVNDYYGETPIAVTW